MSGFYIDSSVLVAAVAPEASTSRVRIWLAAHADAAAISDWTLVEVASALALKQRTGQLSAQQRGAAKAMFALLWASLEVVPVTRRHFQAAAEGLSAEPTGLRGPDALHLAVCSERRDTLVTHDRLMAEAAARLGLAALEP